MHWFPDDLKLIGSKSPTACGALLWLQDSFEVSNESMDIAITLLDRFGSVVTQKGLQSRLQPALLPLLDDNRTALRKRAITCLGASHAARIWENPRWCMFAPCRAPCIQIDRCRARPRIAH